MRIPRGVLLLLGILLTISPAMHGQGNGTFSEPNSALLFGRFGSSLYVVTPTKTIELRDVREGGAPVNFCAPSLARSLDRIAWSVEKGDQTEIGVYTVRDQSQKSFADVCYAGGGPIAFSPDATKIAFVSAVPPTPMHDVCTTPHQTVLQILDLATGRITKLSCCGWALHGRLGWSPDGKEIAVEYSPRIGLGQIAIVESDTGKARTIADGGYPSWSPKGDWIAYFDMQLAKCFVVHPDGSGMKIVRDGENGFRYHAWDYGAVWSPDGRKLLLNEGNASEHFKVIMVDVATGKTTTKSTNGLAALDWVLSN
jgi:Tol biopolymer transport system component